MTKPVRTNRVPIMLTDAELTLIDDYRFANRVGTRSGAMRSLIKIASRMLHEQRERELAEKRAARDMAKAVKQNEWMFY